MSIHKSNILFNVICKWISHITFLTLKHLTFLTRFQNEHLPSSECQYLFYLYIYLENAEIIIFLTFLTHYFLTY